MLRQKGSKRAPDGKFYLPNDPIWATFAGSDGMDGQTDLTPEQASVEAMAAMQQNPPPSEGPVNETPEMEATGTADARKAVAGHGEPKLPAAMATDEFLSDLKNVVQHYKDHTSKVAEARPQVPEAEKMADAQALDLVRQVDAEKKRRARMSPEEFRAAKLPPISSYILHMRSDPSHLVNAKGERPVERDEIIHWVRTDNAQTDRFDDPQWVLEATASGSQLIYDENGAPIYRHNQVAMRCKADRSAHRKAFALEGKTQLGIRESQHLDQQQMETSRQAGIVTGGMETRQRGMVDPFEASRMRPGEQNIPIF